MNNSGIDPAGICAHATVKRQVMEGDGRVYDEQWRCPDCGIEFVRMPSFFPSGPITAMEPQATLRDQFAMAAMAGAMASPQKVFANLDEVVRGAYRAADAMMKARKEKDAKVV